MVSGDRPVVHVTQGTIANDDLGELVGRTVRVLACDDVLVVATTGGADPAVLGPLPANARAAILQVLGEPALRRGADRLRDAYARIDTPAEIVRLVEGVVRPSIVKY